MAHFPGMERRATFAIGLLHYPVYNRRGEICTTAVVNADIHDLARLARTYGALKYYLVTPLPAQEELVGKLVGHWTKGYGARFNPSRAEALSLVKVLPSLEACREDMKGLTGKEPKVCVSGANFSEELTSHEELRELMKRDDASFLIVFGTGWGLAEEVVKKADYRLAPIKGLNGYNHLSVRCAAAIILDRLLA